MDKLDKEIQEALDQDKLRKSEVPDQETKTYQAVYEALNSLPNEDYLSISFADNVISKVKVKSAIIDSEALWWFGSVIFFLLISGIIVLFMTMGALGVELAEFVSKYSPMMALLTFVIIGVQLLDKRLIKFQV